MMNNLLYCPHGIGIERRCPHCVTDRRISYSRRLRYLNNLTDYENRLLELQDMLTTYTFNNNRYLEIQVRQRIINDINFVINLINHRDPSEETRNTLNFYNNMLSSLIAFSPYRRNNLLELGNSTQPERTRNIITINELNNNSSLSVSNNYEDNCTICLEKYKENQVIRNLNCNHSFHQSCVDKWFENHQSCPICRTTLLNGNVRETIV